MLGRILRLCELTFDSHLRTFFTCGYWKVFFFRFIFIKIVERNFFPSVTVAYQFYNREETEETLKNKNRQ